MDPLSLSPAIKNRYRGSLEGGGHARGWIGSWEDAEMTMPHSDRCRAGAIFATMVFVLACAGLPARAAEVDPEAERILRQMSEHLAGLPAFSITTDASTEIILRNGQKVQLTSSGSGVFDRNQGFRFRRQGAVADLELNFDGANLTIYAGGLNAYETIQVEGGNDAALDEVRTAFGIEAAGGVDLLYAHPYEGLLYEVERGDYFGEAWVGGVRAHHLAYRAADIDWQLWVRADGDPLPLKYIITSKWLTGAPQFTVQVREWDTAVTVSAADLTFTPPTNARALSALELDALGLAHSD